MQFVPRNIVKIILILFFASEAYAAQSQLQVNNAAYYLSTPQKAYSDGITQYPNEIYLPNEGLPLNYRIHSNFTKSTDACASCHSTHTAVGSSLLQWYLKYETCMACHDGTVGTTYNVEAGILPNGQLAPGGAFGNGGEQYSSYHNVTGGVLNGSAPGNNENIGNMNDKPLGCESCHSPHGIGGNARLLNPDPNGVQSRKADSYKNFQLTDIGRTNEPVPGVVYVAYPHNVYGNPNIEEEPYYMLNGYPYQIKITINDEVYSQDSYVIDNRMGFTRIIILDEFKGINITKPVYAEFIPSLRVRMNITNYLAQDSFQGVSEQVYYIDGTVAFCSACHSDYNDKLEGVISNVYRHPVDRNVTGAVYTDTPIYNQELRYKLEGQKMVCLTCHVAHGVSQDYWETKFELTPEQAEEQGGSSALKRAPNEMLCEGCHSKGVVSEVYNPSLQEPHNNPDFALNNNLFTQALGLASYIGNNASTCSTGQTSCHQPIVETWGETQHALSLQNNTAINTYAEDDFDNHTNISISQVAYVIGNKRTQRYIYIEGESYKVAQNEYIISNNTWVNKPEQDFIRECAGCHVTGLDVTNATWKDNGITCEACHGSASNHFIIPSSRNITNPRNLKYLDQTDVCAQCHSFGYSIFGDEYSSFPIGYMPYAQGLNKSVWHDSYALSNYFTPYTVDDLAYRGNFYLYPNPSSSIYDSVYPNQEYNDFVQSKHYQSNTMSCISCHSSHQPNSEGQMLKRTFQQVCGECHGSGFDINIVMPKRSIFTNNPIDNLRTHTFSTNHSQDLNQEGEVLLTH